MLIPHGSPLFQGATGDKTRARRAIIHAPDHGLCRDPSVSLHEMFWAALFAIMSRERARRQGLLLSGVVYAHDFDGR